MLKLNKKMQKRVYFFTWVHVDATWHSGPRGSATRAHAVPTRQGDVCYYLHIYFTYYIVHNVQPSIYRKGIQPSESAFLLNPIVSFNFLPVGLKSLTIFKMQVTWTYAGRRIGRGAEDGASIACARGPSEIISTRASINRIITAEMKRWGAHLDRPIAIEGARCEAF